MPINFNSFVGLNDIEDEPIYPTARRSRGIRRDRATRDAEAGKIELENAKTGAWSGYLPKPEPGTGISPDTSINYPDALSSQGWEAYRRGGLSRVQGLQGISDVSRQKAESDEASAEVKRLVDLTSQAKTQMEVLISSDNYTNKSMDELIAKKNRYEKTGNSYPSDVLDFEIKQINRVRGLAKLEPITVRDLNNINEFKVKLGVRDSETVVKNYNELLLPSTTPERKAEIIGELSSQVPEIRKRNGDPKMFMEIDEGLKQQTAELAKLATEKKKEPTPPMYIEKPVNAATQQKFRYNPETGEHDIPFGKPYPIYKPEDVEGKASRLEDKRLLANEKKIEKKEKAKNALDKWFADAVTKAGGQLAPTPEGGFEIVGESFMGIKGKDAKGNDSKINSLKTIYDKSLKGIERAYGVSPEKTEAPKLTKQQLFVEKKQAIEAIKARPDLAEKIKAMYKQETGFDYE